MCPPLCVCVCVRGERGEGRERGGVFFMTDSPFDSMCLCILDGVSVISDKWPDLAAADR